MRFYSFYLFLLYFDIGTSNSPLKPVTNTGIHMHLLPSQPYPSIPRVAYRVALPSSINTGNLDPDQPSQPYQYWVVSVSTILNNPINTGKSEQQHPSQPYQYWGHGNERTFTTLSILGSCRESFLHNPINTRKKVRAEPSQPYQYWGLHEASPFTTLSILGLCVARSLQNPINTG